MLALAIRHQPHRAFAHLGGERVRCLAHPGSPLLRSWCLRQTRRASVSLCPASHEQSPETPGGHTPNPWRCLVKIFFTTLRYDQVEQGTQWRLVDKLNRRINILSLAVATFMSAHGRRSREHVVKIMDHGALPVSLLHRETEIRSRPEGTLPEHCDACRLREKAPAEPTPGVFQPILCSVILFPTPGLGVIEMLPWLKGELHKIRTSARRSYRPSGRRRIAATRIGVRSELRRFRNQLSHQTSLNATEACPTAFILPFLVPAELAAG